MSMGRVSIFLLGLAVAFVPAAARAETTAPGVPNFHEVNSLVYRGGMPTTTGFESLAKLGVKTVVDLCDEHSPAAEQRAVEAAGMRFVSIPMNGHGIAEPSAKLVAKALDILDSATGPVFVHCEHGSDRTGTVIACYRIEHDHWNAAAAQREANQYGMSWLNVGMKRYIRNYTAPTQIADAVAAGQ